MANEITQALKNTATKIAEYVDNIATMSVQTDYVLVEGGANPPQLVAKTTVKLDGDSTNTVPLVKGPDGNLTVDQELFDIHKANVATAVDYRSRMIAALLNALQALRSS
jgi:hypothetical protein